MALNVTKLSHIHASRWPCQWRFSTDEKMKSRTLLCPHGWRAPAIHLNANISWYHLEWILALSHSPCLFDYPRQVCNQPHPWPNRWLVGDWSFEFPACPSVPGIAMTISTPLCKLRICGPLGAPPNMAVLRMRIWSMVRVINRGNTDIWSHTQTVCILAGFVWRVLKSASEQERWDHRQVLTMAD